MDVASFNMKQLMSKLAEHYKGQDLSSKKSFIKEIAVDYVQKHLPPAEEAAGEREGLAAFPD